jgi:TPR repeat protein
MSWWQKSVGAGNAKAMYNIGDLYEKGEGVAQDQQKAIIWYRKAAALGEERAKKRLADLAL